MLSRLGDEGEWHKEESYDKRLAEIYPDKYSHNYGKDSGGFDFFQSFLQYCMSMVVLVPFIGGHASTGACDNVDGWEGTDMAIATVATLEAWLLLIPAIYEIAKVLVPGLPASFTPLDDVEFKHDPKASWFHLVKFTSFSRS